MKPTYSEQLRDPRWQKKRLEILQRDGFRCKMCFSENSELHIHHVIYLRNKPIWEVGDENLVTLCADCHASVTEVRNKVASCLHHDPNLEFFDACYSSLGEDNWLEVQMVVKKLISRPKEVAKLYKKFFKS